MVGACGRSLWPRALAEHDALVLDAVERAGGYVEGSEGDALFAYFVGPSAALEAAIAVQRGLRAHAWPADVGELRVRMGLHVGYGRACGDRLRGLGGPSRRAWRPRLMAASCH